MAASRACLPFSLSAPLKLLPYSGLTEGQRSQRIIATCFVKMLKQAGKSDCVDLSAIEGLRASSP